MSRRVSASRAAVLVLLLAACRAASDAERLGDQAYMEARYPAALQQYQAAAKGRSESRLWGKIGLTAVHAERWQDAIDAYLHLASDDPSRADEAADGLEEVARAAERVPDRAALKAAVVGLRAIAPTRPIGRYALDLVRQADLAPGELLPLFPAALAGASDAGTLDSLLFAYGEALAGTGSCDQAVAAYATVRRRSVLATLNAEAGTALVACAVQLGTADLQAGNGAGAARWLGQAVAVDSTSVSGRRTLILLGDARIAAGDTLAAALAFQAAMTVETPDSISQMAAERLNALTATETVH